MDPEQQLHTETIHRPNQAERPLRTAETPRIEVRCRGDQSDIGLALGSQLAGKIAQAERELVELEAFRLAQPWWMPASVYQYMAQWRARWMLEPSMGQMYPNMLERLEAMASGADTTVDFLLLFHAMESAATSTQQTQFLETAPPLDPAYAACTAVAVAPSRARAGRAMVAHNFDLVDSAGPLLTVRDCRPGNEYRYLGFSLAPMAGVVDGINEHGLAISYNYAPTTDLLLENPPVSFAVERALCRCRSVQQAIDEIARLPRSGGALLMLADSSGDLAALELSAEQHAVRRPEGDHILFHSNAYRSERMQRYEIPRNSIYAAQAPLSLRHQPVYQSALAREYRVHELLEQLGSVDEESLSAVMADHEEHPLVLQGQTFHDLQVDDLQARDLEAVSTGTSARPLREGRAREGQGTANTICMHGEYWSTMAAVQLFPHSRRLRIAYGPACQARYHDFAL